MNSTRYRACVAMAVNVYVAEREDVVFFSFRLLIPSCFIKDVDSKPRGNSLEPSAGPEYSLETGHTPQVTAIRGGICFELIRAKRLLPRCMASRQTLVEMRISAYYGRSFSHHW